MPGEPQSSNNNNPVNKKSKRVKMENRFKGVLERKIEGIFEEAQELGWNYTRFVSSVLEILVILRHRNKLR
jgi:hypothetical protein